MKPEYAKLSQEQRDHLIAQEEALYAVEERRSHGRDQLWSWEMAQCIQRLADLGYGESHD